MVKSFSDMGVCGELISALKKQNITVPTKVQEMTYSKFIEKKDLCVKSETGSGKTLAYLLPVFSLTDTSLRAAQTIIITPTHELSSQVFKQAELLIKNSGMEVRAGLFIGGANFDRQVENIKKNKPHIIIGSAGRILDLIKKKKLSVHHVKTIVLDEADRLTDDLNFEAIRDVIKCTLKERQIVLFSASVDEESCKNISDLLKDCEFLSVFENNKIPESIKHYYIKCEWREKIDVLKKILHAEKPKKTIVFLNNPMKIDVTVDKLKYSGFKAAGLYGIAADNQRKNSLQNFKFGDISILVSGDLGARGLDIKDVTHIINLDLPEDPVFYLHRAGRAGRQNKDGIVISLITAYEKKWINKYEKAFNIKFEEKKMAFGHLSDINEKPKIKKPIKNVKMSKNIGEKIAKKK